MMTCEEMWLILKPEGRLRYVNKYKTFSSIVQEGRGCMQEDPIG